MLPLGFDELTLVALVGLLLFSPAEVAGFVRKVRVWSVTLRSWAEGMWKGL